MNDRITSQLSSYRTRLVCLDKPEHKAIWENNPPAIFTTKVTAARAATAALADTASRQSAPVTGDAANKAREEKELEGACYKVARAVVSCCQDLGDEATAAKYDMPLSGWRRMRDEALLLRARLLETDATTLATGPNAVTAALYGVTPAAVALLASEGDDYDELVVAPQAAIGGRSALTGSLPTKSREAAALFAQLEDFLPQFGSTAEGFAFVAAYLESTMIIERGRGPAPEPSIPPQA